MQMTVEERLKWWHEVRFGMFIHWGLYASLAGEWNGKQTPFKRDPMKPAPAFRRWLLN